MTVLEDRIEMADTNVDRLDQWFERLERMPVPEGIKVEIVGGNVFMTPQRSVHWHVIRRIIRALEDRFGMDVEALSDVRIDFPGHENGFCPDVVKMRDGATDGAEGRWRHEDVEFVAEVISRGTAQNDYGPKKDAYAAAEVPVYLIADPYQGKCHLFTQPKDGEYVIETSVGFGADVDMTGTVLGLTLKTDEFPRD
ncbi:Uma2 family endonuclease [Streptomyces phaeochromogenes]|jgi:Uma2 family endonuclease|uniref:Uma2 family endonuclease n=1 Tax=Streptomyces TaxID=1883 RepID=UPI0022B362A6|nr:MULTISPECIES: Uma2 family endonuclease [Streptomyces]MCZ4514698.1 Uma2 family endonuclease [Streptomyces sp. ActVer]MDQ0950603.1 Uma2 family endonuclease [Streptomyces phaeochromogenes]